LVAQSQKTVFIHVQAVDKTLFSEEEEDKNSKIESKIFLKRDKC